MPANKKAVELPPIAAKVTSKGQITIPIEIRRQLGVKPGDKVRFERSSHGISLVSDSTESVFEKWRGIGNAEIGSGREPIENYMRELRGHDEYDDLLA